MLLLQMGLLTFESDTFNGTPSVSTSGASRVIFEIPIISPPSYVTIRNPSVLAQTYDNKINGKIVLWNQKKGILTVVNDKQPISNDYNSAIVEDEFTRNASG